MTAITVDRLCKSYRGSSDAGAGNFDSYYVRETEVEAVRDISFAIGRGERFAFIGPNGAGKSTTLKMLTGILTPTSGHADVLGFVPWRERRALAYRIGIVFGQRSQLWHHLPVGSSFELLRRVYGVAEALYVARLARLAKVFDVGAFLDRTVSQLSLGQRLRCEVVAALLQAPDLLLLDEPSIGLDVTAKAALHDHLRALSREDGTTVLLTSHDTGDIEEICERVIVIDRGRGLLDQSLGALRREFMQRRTVALVTTEETPALDLPGVLVAAREPHRLVLSVDTSVVALEKVVTAALQQLGVRDLVIENPPLDDFVRAIYARGQS